MKKILFTILVSLALINIQPFVASASAAKPDNVSQECFTNFTKNGTEDGCSPAELAALDASNKATFNDASNSQGQAAQIANQGKNATKITDPVPQVCGGVLGALSSWQCLINTVMTSVAAFLISISVTIIVAVGWLFDVVINQTVLGFNGWIGDKGVSSAIEFGWTFFRDISNIVIIGLFVFIAINMILGNKNYGEKKLIARVLIVAVLINFSFLFTRIVINFSNAIACQFSKSLIAPTGDNGSATCASIAQTKTPVDVAGKFTTLMGVKSWGDTKVDLAKIAANQNSIWIAMMHALIVVIIAMAVALVLLYASILLIARAIIFIFLLITSSFAFATYLIPTWASSEFGWKAWWIALFRNAMLAPAMMLLLYLTFKVSGGLVAVLKASGAVPNSAGAGGDAGIGALGALAANPNAENSSALLLYLVILGLLYGAISIANKFSGAAGQFAYAGTLPFANASVAFPARGLGLLGRNSAGLGAYFASKKLGETASKFRQGTIGNFTFDKLSQGVKSIAKRDFNAGNLTNIKAAQTGLGGFAGQRDRSAKASVDRAQRTAPTDELIKKERERASAIANKEVDAERRSNAVKKEGAEQQKKAMQDVIKAATDSTKTLEKDSEKLKAQFNQMTDVERRGDAGQALKKQISEKEGEMTKRKTEIETARGTAQEATKTSGDAQRFEEILRQRVAARTDELMPSGMKADVLTKRDSTGAVVDKDRKERVSDAAVQQSLNTLPTLFKSIFKPQNEKNNALAQEVRKMAGNIRKQTEKTEALEALFGKDYALAQKALEKQKDIKSELSEVNANLKSNEEHDQSPPPEKH